MDYRILETSYKHLALLCGCLLAT